MEPRQLELDLDGLIQDAMASPMAADLRQIWQRLEPLIRHLPDHEQLRVAGKAINLLAEVYQSKARQLLDAWEEGYNNQGPVISDELLAGLVQQTMHLDISNLIKKPQQRRSKKIQPVQPDDSVVGVVEKEQILAFIDAQEEAIAKEQALAAAYDEDVSAWAEAIRSWMEKHAKKRLVSLVKLHQGLEMPLVVLWLGLLLGGFELEQRGEFYEQNIWVRSPPASNRK
jgi:hypothetical protein